MSTPRTSTGLRTLLVCVIGLIVALVATPSRAQTGGLEIILLDAERKEPLPGATVTLSSDQGSIAPSTSTTDANGRVNFPVLRVGGGYVIEAVFPGFARQRLTDLQVTASETARFVLQMSPAIEERVRVSAVRDVVDLEQTESTTRFSETFIESLPVRERLYQNLLTLAPGVNDADGDGNPNVHGARDRDFKTLVGGVSNVDPLTGQWLGYVNPDSIEELEVLTAGAGVEFGRAQGGYGRILQKQGSNDFEGTFSFLFRSSIFDGNGTSSELALTEPEFETVQPSLLLAGPIIRDRLWYRLSHMYLSEETPVNILRGIAITTRTQNIGSHQLTWQVSPRNKLALRYDHDPVTIENVDLSSRVGPESSHNIERGGPTYGIAWTAAQSPRLLVESQAAWQDHQFDLLPSDPTAQQECTIFRRYGSLQGAHCLNATIGEESGPYNQVSLDRRQRLTVRTDGTHYAGRLFGMSHQLKFGMIIENERYFRTLERRPDITFTFSHPQLPPPVTIGQAAVKVFTPVSTNANAAGTAWAFYVEDQLKPRDNLVVTVGLRLDREEIRSAGKQVFDPRAEAEQFFDEVNPHDILSLFRTGSRVFTGFEDIQDYQRHLAEALGVPIDTIALGDLSVQTDWLKKRKQDDITISNTNLSPRLSVAWDPWSNGKTKLAIAGGRYYDKIFLAVPLVELEPVYTTFHATAIQNTHIQPLDVPNLFPAADPTVSVQFVDRKLQTPYQDELSASFERALWAETSIKLGWLRRAFRDQLQDVDINHRKGVVLNPGWGELLMVGNFNEADYEAWILELVRRLYRNWELNASYTRSKAEGDAEDFLEQRFGNSRDLLVVGRGPLSYDQRHVARVNAATLAPWGVRLGGSMRWESGVPYSILQATRIRYEIPVLYSGLGNVGFFSGYAFPTGQRNDQRNKGFWTFDVRAAKQVPITRDALAEVSVEVFNLMNDDTLIKRNALDGAVDGTRRFGRQFQLGVKVTF